MNIFLPYERSIEKSVQSLDNSRLVKQILECQTMLNAILNNYTKGYINHPVTQFYKNNPEFICAYGFECCIEYEYRFGKEHNLCGYFLSKCNELKINLLQIYFIPFYASGSKNSIDCIRTTENVSVLFQNKLINKWLNDKREPNWGKRGMPQFYSTNKSF